MSGATFGSVEETVRRWGFNSRIHTVGDGAEWIRLQSREVFGKQATFLCDFFQVSEYLERRLRYAARPAGLMAPDATAETQARRGAERHATLAGQVEAETTPDEETPVRTAQRYLNNRMDAWTIPEPCP